MKQLAVLKRFIAVRRKGRTNLRRRLKLLVLGRELNRGLLFRIALYVVLADIALLYLKPFLEMISDMFKSDQDYYDVTVHWIPRHWDFANIWLGWKLLNYSRFGLNTATIAILASLFQVFACAITGYALARLQFPFKRFWTFLVLVTFLIPPQTIIIPLYMMYFKFGMLKTALPFTIPALLGQGLKGSLFVIIFRQFFRTLPGTLEEAARIDGAGAFRLYFKVMFPLAQPAILVVFLFSFVWHWNEYYLSSQFLSGPFQTLPMQLNNLQAALADMPGYTNARVTPQTYMAASFWIVFPPLLLFFIAQKWFVQGVERTGLVE